MVLVDHLPLQNPQEKLSYLPTQSFCAGVSPPSSSLCNASSVEEIVPLFDGASNDGGPSSFVGDDGPSSFRVAYHGESEQVLGLSTTMVELAWETEQRTREHCGLR